MFKVSAELLGFWVDVAEFSKWFKFAFFYPGFWCFIAVLSAKWQSGILQSEMTNRFHMWNTAPFISFVSLDLLT